MDCIDRASPAVIGKEMRRRLTTVMLAASVMISVFLCGVAEGQSFSDDFNRPDGNVDNGWTPYGNGASIVGGRLQTIGGAGTGGGVFRTLPVTLPVTFSFDFTTAQPADGGWFIAFNAVSTLVPGPPAGQTSLQQYTGSSNIIRRTPSGFEF